MERERKEYGMRELQGRIEKGEKTEGREEKARQGKGGKGKEKERNGGDGWGKERVGNGKEREKGRKAKRRDG